MANMNEHLKRAATLRRIGFRSYDGYLSSCLWKGIRSRVLERDSHKCRLCGDETITVHHHDYDEETMRGVSLDRLFAICGTCHLSIEFEGGRKRPLADVQSIFLGRLGVEVCPAVPSPAGSGRQHAIVGRATPALASDLSRESQRKANRKKLERAEEIAIDLACLPDAVLESHLLTLPRAVARDLRRRIERLVEESKRLAVGRAARRSDR